MEYLYLIVMVSYFYAVYMNGLLIQERRFDHKFNMFYYLILAPMKDATATRRLENLVFVISTHAPMKDATAIFDPNNSKIHIINQKQAIFF